MDKEIMEAFKKENVFVTSTLNYVIYEAGYKAGLVKAKSDLTAHNSDYAKSGVCSECANFKDCESEDKATCPDFS